jgi:hypothetical protein
VDLTVAKLDKSGLCVFESRMASIVNWTSSAVNGCPSDQRTSGLPDDKVIIPGVLDTTTNYIEHPELVAQRLVQYAKLVGREKVIAGADCGFGTFCWDTDIASRHRLRQTGSDGGGGSTRDASSAGEVSARDSLGRHCTASTELG